MKKILLILILLTAACGWVSSQTDPWTSIGKLKLRYDVDSNRFRIGWVGTNTGLGNLRLAKEGNGQLFDINSAHFTWSTTTGLNLANSVFQQDSIFTKIMTVGRDSSWIEIGETVSKWRSYSFKKRFWSNAYSFPDIKLYYLSVSQAGTIDGKDSFFVVNHADMVHSDSYNYEVAGVDAWSDLDTVTLPTRGLYVITYTADLLFPYTLVSGVDARDTAQFKMIDAGAGQSALPGSLVTIWKDFKDTETGIGSPIEQFYQPEQNPVSRTFKYQTGADGTILILKIRADLNTSLINVAATKPQITYELVR